MRILIALLTIYVALLVASGVASAQDSAPETPIALQTSPWDIVGLAGKQEVSATPNSCAMQTTYDNGLKITFKATGKRLTAMRLETVQGQLIPDGFVGFVGLGVNKNSYAVQSQMSDGRIDSTLLTVPNLADKLSEATVFRIKLGMENTYFALQGFAEAYHRLLVCMGIVPTKTLKVVDDSRDTPRPPMNNAPQINPVSGMPANPVADVEADSLTMADADTNAQPLMPTPLVDETVAVDDVNEVDATREEKGGTVVDEIAADDTTIPAQKPETLETPGADLPEWRALKGQTLSSVLTEWSDKEGVKTHIALDRDPVLTKDIISNGSFEMAVNNLLSQTGMAANTSAIVKNGEGRVTHVAGYQGSALRKTLGLKQSEENTVERWRALQGTDLRKVLMQWSSKAGVEFVWDAPETYLVRESVKAVADYEEAVALLLNQFKSMPTRPTAQLNQDPDTGRKSLIIKTYRSQS